MSSQGLGPKLLLFAGIVLLTSCGTSDKGGSSATSPTSSWPDATTQTRFIYAHYMHCFVFGATPVISGSEDWENWTLTEFSSPSWWPESYSSQSDSGITAIQQDFAWGTLAGLDAFAVLSENGQTFWQTYGPGLNGMAQIASGGSVKIFPDLWNNSTFTPSVEGMQQYGQEVKAWMDAYPNAFARYDGKLVIGLGAGFTTPAAAAVFSHFFDAWGGQSHFYVIADVTSSGDALWSQSANAISSWTPGYSWSGGDQLGWLIPDATRLRRDVAWPITASYFETHHPWPNPRMMAEDLGVSKFVDSWSRVLESRVPIVQLQTWNDFNEDTAFTDLNVRGTSLIDLNAYFAAWMHRGGPPPITSDSVFLFRHRQLTTTVYTDATEIAVTEAWASDTPTTDYIDVVTLLTEPALITVSTADGNWQEHAPAGLYQWLLYVPSPITAYSGGNGPAYRQADSYPVESQLRHVTVINHLGPGTPTVSVERMGKMVIQGASRTGWPSVAKWQDMSLIGDEFRSGVQ